MVTIYMKKDLRSLKRSGMSNHVSIRSSDIHQRDWPVDIIKPYQYLS